MFNNEEIYISKKKVNLKLNGWSWKDGNYVIVQVPSVQVSSYGKDINEAKEMLKEVLDDFCYELIKMKPEKSDLFLKGVGFNQPKFTRKYSKAYVDKNGTIQNLQLSEEQIKTLKEESIAA